MSISNSFPIFEADQVLTNNHLNNLFNYLDQQSRLTRIKLIGSGIVCGLEIKYSANTINVSKGCGLTSQGYMITFCDTEYSHSIPYTSPGYPNDLKLITQCSDNDEISGEGFLFYGNYGQSVFQLITQIEFDNLNADEKATAIALSQTTKSFLDSYAVVLFLDAEEENLKNCDTNDCNDKGSRMDFEVRALLADKSLLGNNVSNTNDSSLLHHVELKRYNVPVRDIKSAEDVLEAFLKLVDDKDTTLTRLSNNLIYCWSHYNYLLKDEGTNPFTDVLAELKQTREYIIKRHPILIQYFYDFIDDLIKAFYEFKHKVFDMLGDCCGDELQFPFHLMLGEAGENTSKDEHSRYRQYFNYSPLFDSQDSKLNEVRSLFTRMKLMVREFVLNSRHEAEKKEFINFDNAVVKITPSQYGRSFLSHRSIPYYYKVNEQNNELYRFWNYDKTRRGSSRFILGYNSNLYNTSDTIVHPLNYDIEWYNFFRIEGHLGKPVLNALTTVKEIQQNSNLPFDVIALSADYIGAILKGEEPKCIIQDLESDYRVLIAEFVCRLHDAFCLASNVKFGKRATFSGLIVTPKTFAKEATVEPQTIISEDEDEDKIVDNAIISRVKAADHIYVSALVSEFHATNNYQKGDTLDRLCNPGKGLLGNIYISIIKKNNGVFENPVPLRGLVPISSLYFTLFEFIDSVESMFKILMTNELAELNVDEFKSAYKRFSDLAKKLNKVSQKFMDEVQLIIDSCIIERLEALKLEYSRRISQFRLAKNFNHYFKQHGGIEHKAGVPKGGTFILVYHEERNNRFIDVRSLFVNKEMSKLMMTRFQSLLKPSVELDEMESNIKMMQVATLYRDPELYMQFKGVMSKFLNDSKDIPKEKKKRLKELIDAPPNKQNIELKDGIVIADFYVPYICCSDCPPVAYILPPPPKDEKEDPTVKIDKNIFCNDDLNEFTITVTPSGGTISGEGIRIRPDGKFVFVPVSVKNTGLVVITYTANGKSVTATVEVLPSSTARFSYTTDKNTDLMFVTLKNESTNTNDQTTYEWLLDGELFSENRDPDTVTFKLGTLPHTIRLKVSNGQCPDEFSTEIKEETEERQISLCRNVKEFPLEPNLSETDIFEVLNNDGIKMMDSGLTILPSATQVDKTATFHVSYMINGKQVNVAITVIVIDAGFTMKLERNTSPIAVFPTILTLSAKLKDAEIYFWQLKTVTGASFDYSTSEVIINLTQLEIPNGSELSIVLKIKNTDPLGTSCTGVKEFVLTRSIFKKHLNQGEFDNLTKK